MISVGNKLVQYMKKKRVIIISLVVICLLFFVSIFYSNYAINSYDQYTFNNINDVPTVYSCILLGTSRKLNDGRNNLYFSYRIQAAFELYSKGKCKKIVVSGDNRTHGYNEPLDMKNDLIAKGIPEADIICDYAGLRTLDSVIRYKEIFGQETGIVVSQKFHNARAIYIARANGIELYGYNATDVDKFNGFKTKVREVISKFKCMLDVNIFNTKPKHLGEKIKI
jgi:SanA protein